MASVTSTSEVILHDEVTVTPIDEGPSTYMLVTGELSVPVKYTTSEYSSDLWQPTVSIVAASAIAERILLNFMVVIICCKR